MPAKATENNYDHNVIRAADKLPANGSTQTIDGVNYQVIYLYGDSDPEQSKIIFNGTADKNYYYIMMDDWTLANSQVSGKVGNNSVYGHSVIFDLHGQVLSCTDWSNGANYFVFHSSMVTLEITDSSLTGGSLNVIGCSAATVIISGNGTYEFASQLPNTNVILRSAKKVRFQRNADDSTGLSFTMAPYMVRTNRNITWFETTPSHEVYAVSGKTGGVDGATSLTVGEVAAWRAADEQMYYLYGRNTNGEYEFLDINYQNNEWFQYETIELTGDLETNRALIEAHTTGYYRYVMTADWVLRGQPINLDGKVVMLDLNGFTLLTNPEGNNTGWLRVFPKTFVLADSSPKQTGRVAGNGIYSFACNKGQKMIFAGGTVDKDISVTVPNYQLIFCGGSFYGSIGYQQDYQLSIPVYYRDQKIGSGVAPYDAYAISNSKIVSGAHNTVFGYAAELTAVALHNLPLPTNQTYYLWGRNANGAYEYLNIYSVDGQWQKF